MKKSKLTITEEKIKILVYECDLYKLYSREVLNKFDNKKLSVIYNGAGSNWMPLFVRDFLTKISYFLEPAFLIHDVQWEYADGTYASFYKSNSDLYDNCYKLLNNKFSGVKNLHKRFFYSKLIDIYVWFCQEFGYSTWKEV